MRTTPGTGEYIATYFFRVQKLTHNCELPVIAEKISKATGCGWQPGGLRRSGWRVIAEAQRKRGWRGQGGGQGKDAEAEANLSPPPLTSQRGAEGWR